MTNTSLEKQVADFAKGVDEIFEQYLKMMNELREALRLISEALQKMLDSEKLPDLETIGVNKNYFNRSVKNSDVRKNKPSEPTRSAPKM